jgi:hypothetical protein
VNLLSEQGVNTIDDLRNEMPAALYARLLRAAEEEGVPRLSMDELRQWADRG